MDPSVALVEEILEAASAGSDGIAPGADGRLRASHAVWLCACETVDDGPVWLVYTVGEDDIGWRRIPHKTDVDRIIQAEHLTGGHPDPERVLAWLRGESPDPWRGQPDFPEHAFIYEELQHRIQAR